MLGLGGSIGFYQGDSRRIQDDVMKLRPTIFCSVPRLLTKFFTEVCVCVCVTYLVNCKKKEV